MNTVDRKPYEILFVCLGNICRSPAAQGIMQSLVDARGLCHDFYLDSAGTYGGHAGDLPDRRMRVHAQLRGLDLTHRSRKVTSNDLEQFDLIVAMDDNNYNDLRYMANSPEETKKIVRMGDYIRHYPNYDYIPDSYDEGSEEFELVLNLLEDAFQILLDALIAKNKDA